MRAGCSRVPLWSVVCEQREVVEPSDLGSEVIHYSIPSVDATGTGRIEDTAEIKSAKLRLRGGEVLISKLNPRKSRVVHVEPSNLPLVSSTEFVGLRGAGSIDHRFLGYLLQAEDVRQQLDARVQSVTRSHQRVDPSDIMHLLVSLPPLGEQRRIADFLDAETTRIDRLTQARQRHLRLIEERWESLIHEELTGIGTEDVELRRLGVKVTTGPFGTVFSAAEYEDGGVPMVNPVHIKNGRILADDRHSVSHAVATRLARHRLNSGDLVVGRKGDIGRAALVTDDQDGWICGSDCIALHPSAEHVRPMFLAYALRSQYLRSQLLANSLATTMPSLNEGNLLSLRVPHAQLAQQDEIVTRVDAAHSWTTRCTFAMESQLKILAERRQALITAAVTGQIDLSTASGRGIED